MIDGVSFWPQLQGEEGKPREWAFCNYWYQGRTKAGENQWIRTQRFKLYSDGTFYDISEDRNEENPIPEGEGMELAQAQRVKLQMALDELAPKIDHSFDYSKKKEYEKAFKNARLAAIEKNKTVPEVKSAYDSLQKLVNERFTLASQDPSAAGLNEQAIQKMIEKRKFKNKSIKVLNNKIESADKMLNEVLIQKDSKFAEIAKIMQKFSVIGKKGLGEG